MKRHAALVPLLVALGILACGSVPDLASTPTFPPAPPTQVFVPSETPLLVSVTVYFTDSARYAAGTPPFEAGVTRLVPATSSLPSAILDEFFRGPLPEERAVGLEAITSGFTGYSRLQVQGGIAHLYLAGPCASNGATYTIAQPILANLLPFPEIDYVKIYDEAGTTEDPLGLSNSIPACLEP